jgi:hypothetical protein
MLSFNIKDLTTDTADSVIVILRRTVNPQPVTSTGDSPAKAIANEHIERLVDR